MRFTKRQTGEWSTRYFGDSSTMRKLVKQYRKHLEWQNIRTVLKSIDWTPYREPRFIAAASTAAFFLVAASTYIHWNMSKTQAWTEVFTNGTYVGLVPNQQGTLGKMKRTAEGYSVDLKLAPVHVAVPGSYNWYQVEQIPEAAYAVTLNGNPLVYTSSPDAADSVVTSVKTALLPKHLNSSAKVSFDGQVSVQKAIVGVADILSVQSAVSYILHPVNDLLATSRGVSPLTNHDTLIQDAALQTGTNESAQVSTAAIQESEQKTSPLLKLQVSEVITKKVKVPFPVKQIKDGSLGVGTVKVVKNGVPGVNKETVKLHYQNDKLVSQKVLQKVVVSKPVEQVEDTGTNSGIASGSWIWPSPDYDITSPYGPRILFGSYSFHPGIDIGCPIGTPIYATNNGVVEDAGWNSGGYGIWVKINNGRGIETVFGHMSRVAVHAGETVAKGQVIGYSGETGFATGPHLHYEVRLNGQHINPAPYM